MQHGQLSPNQPDLDVVRADEKEAVTEERLVVGEGPAIRREQVSAEDNGEACDQFGLRLSRAGGRPSRTTTTSG